MQRLILARAPGADFVLSATVQPPATAADRARVERQLGEWRMAAEGPKATALALRTYAVGLEALLVSTTKPEHAGQWCVTLPRALGHGEPVRYASLAADYIVVMYALAMAHITPAQYDDRAARMASFVLRRSSTMLRTMLRGDSLQCATTRRVANMCDADDFYALAAAAIDDPLEPTTFAALRQVVSARGGGGGAGTTTTDRSLDALVRALEQRASYLRAQTVRTWLRPTQQSLHAFEALKDDIDKLRALSSAYVAFACDLTDAALLDEARAVREDLRVAHITMFTRHHVNLHQYEETIDVSTSERRLEAYAAAGFVASTASRGMKPTTTAAANDLVASLEAEWTNARQSAIALMWEGGQGGAATRRWIQCITPLPTTIQAPVTTGAAVDTTVRTRSDLMARWALQVVGGPGTSAERRAQYAADLVATHGLLADELADVEAAIKDELAAIARVAAGPTLFQRMGAAVSAAVARPAAALAPAPAPTPPPRQARTFDQWWKDIRSGQKPVPAELLDMISSPVGQIGRWYVRAQHRPLPPIWLVYYPPETWHDVLGVTTPILNKWGVRRSNWGSAAILAWCSEEKRDLLWPRLNF